MTILEQVSHETMKFMRGKYRLDEIGDGKDELKFKDVFSPTNFGFNFLCF